MQYKKGDLFNHLEEHKNPVIIHVCNDIGRWGKGFVVPLGNYFPGAKKLFSNNYRNGVDSELGNIQIYENDMGTVINMIAQTGIYPVDGVPPIRYKHLKRTLEGVAAYCKEKDVEIVMPKIGAGLAGGNWLVIEEYIKEILVKKGIKVTVYEL